jgi:hypothetical protein
MATKIEGKGNPEPQKNNSNQTGRPEQGNKRENNVGSVVTGIILFLIAGIYLYLLFERLRNTAVQESPSADIINSEKINEAILIMLAGGIGSLIYAIRAYLKHACDRQDFRMNYIPWYIYWNIQGSILGLIFYFTLRGGLLLVIMNGEARDQASLNTWSILAIGALVGLFSKYAIDKLRQIFIMIFTNKSDLDREEAEEQIISEKRKLTLEIEKEKLQKELADMRKN